MEVFRDGFLTGGECFEPLKGVLPGFSGVFLLEIFKSL
jgi:hypothetical protein